METINARHPSPRYNVVDPRRINIEAGGGVGRAFIFSIAGLGNELFVCFVNVSIPPMETRNAKSIVRRHHPSVVRPCSPRCQV